MANIDSAVFVRADSSNLPNVDSFMLMEFMKNSDKYNAAEIRGVKALHSSRESYVETAVGYVELKRAGPLCVVRAKIVPEHKIASKYYIVTVDLDNDTITDTSCGGCAAAAGGCKHTILMLYWLQKRSSEPSPTSIKCYWVKPSLKGAQYEVIQCSEIFTCKKKQMGPKDTSVVEKFRAEAKSHACSKSLIMAHGCSINTKKQLNSYCLFNLMIDFFAEEDDNSFENFKEYSEAKVVITRDKIYNDTISQVNSKLWHAMRQGRITGSKIYEIAHCGTPDGSLVQEILGGYKYHETKAMKRGKHLEKKILGKMEKELNKRIHESGFMLINGIFGASPDGACEDFVVEVKCPISDKTKKNYIKDGKVTDKCMGQIQLQMLATKKLKCLFCVASPNFEVNEQVEKVWVDYNEHYLESLMKNAEEFWKINIFPKILNSARVCM